MYATYLYLEAEHISPVFAQEFLTLIIREADDHDTPTVDVKRANEAIAYLTSELETTALTEIRNSINHSDATPTRTTNEGRNKQ